MSQYPGHPPYGHHGWPQQYAGHPHGMPGGPYSSPGSAVSAGGQVATAGPRSGQVSNTLRVDHPSVKRRVQNPHPLSQVYSFVPIPGAQQHKRPRRRYEEIERMYKCGWHGCEKAYGTLNHLNAHVTMQSHGNKRTPEGTFGIFVVAKSRLRLGSWCLVGLHNMSLMVGVDAISCCVFGAR